MDQPAPTRTGRCTGRAGPRHAAIACCLAVGVAGIACSRDGDVEPGPTTHSSGSSGATAAPATTSPGTSAVADEEAAVLAAVDGYWRTWLAANDPPNPDHPDLETYATGGNLDQLRKSIELNRKNGIRIVAGPIPIADAHNPTVVDIDDSQAEVRDCFTDDLVQIAITDGSVVNDEVVTQVLNYRLSQTGESWKIENVTREARWDDGRGCS